jgi:NAD(P)H dehydrogenase (quinone)
MQKPKILVTGATGKTGSATVLQLIEKGYPVRALVHRLDARSEPLKKAGAEVALGSLEDLVDLRNSMTGVQRAYFCPPLEPGTLRRATLFAAAAQEAKLEVVVALSQWVSDALHPATHSREKWLTNRVLEWIPGVGVITVNPGFFADNYMAALEPIAQFGLMGLPLGEGLNAPPSNEDIARVIVGAITNPAPHIGRHYRPTGPRLLSPEEMAAVFAKVLGRKVKYQNAPLKLFLKVAKSLGISNFVIEELYWFLQDYQRNSFGVGAPTDAVLTVGGAPPEEFEQIVRRYVAASPVSKNTLGNKLRAMANLARALATPAPNPEAIARGLALPKISHATLAADSAEWHAAHDLAPQQSDDRTPAYV